MLAVDELAKLEAENRRLRKLLSDCIPFIRYCCQFKMTFKRPALEVLSDLKKLNL